MTDNEAVTLRLTYIRESRRSICFESETGRAWIERGQIQSRRYIADGVFLITIPADLADKKNLK